MLGIFIGVGSFFILLLCFWIVLLVLMQKPSSNSGMGAALGGGVAESAFGGEASKVLTRWTVYGIVAFFIGTMTLTLAQLYRSNACVEKRELAPIQEPAEKVGSLTSSSTAESAQQESSK